MHEQDEKSLLHLHEISLFEDIRENGLALRTLIEVMKVKDYPPNTQIVREGELGSELFLLTEGQASVFKSTTEGDPYRVAILHAEKHPFFGEGALLDSEARSATIVTDTAARCLILDRNEFIRFGKSHPEWAFPVLLKIAQVVMGRFRKSNNDLLLVYNALVDEIRG